MLSESVDTTALSANWSNVFSNIPIHSILTWRLSGGWKALLTTLISLASLWTMRSQMILSPTRRVCSGLIAWIGRIHWLQPKTNTVLTFDFSLDRTNFVQDILSRTTLEQYLLLVRREWIHSNALWTHHRELWAENGDALSRIYAGTGALNTSFTRSGKRTLAGVKISFSFSSLILILQRRSFWCYQKCITGVYKQFSG